MHASSQHPNDTAARVALELSPRPRLYTVEQFSEAQPAFTPASLRNLIFKAEPRQSTKGEIRGNGLLEYGAIVRIGRKVLIDAERFFAWAEGQGRRT